MNIAVYTDVVIKKDPRGVAYIENITESGNKTRVDIYYDKKYKKIEKMNNGMPVKIVTGTFESEQPFKTIFSSAHNNLDNLELEIPLEAAEDYGYGAPFLKIKKIKFEKIREI